MWDPDQWKVNKGKIQGPRRGATSSKVKNISNMAPFRDNE